MLQNSNEIQYLCRGTADFELLPSLPKLTPFSQQACDFLAELSSEIMKNPESRQYPDVITFGFFCRKGNVSKLKEAYQGKIENRLGRGVSFHIAPSNVPINFAYSMVAAFLAGNACIVRASAKPFRQIDLVCECMNRVFEQDRFKALHDYITVVRYPRSKEINDYFSSLSDVRVIWGGDATISEIRQSPLPPRSIEIAFADRYSIAVFDAKAMCAAENMTQIARDFYNDTYLYDQNACSSPRLIYWLGSEEEAQQASERFWTAIHESLQGKYTVEPVIAVDKYTAACRCAIDLGAEIKPWRDNLISRIRVSHLRADVIDYRCAGGSFFEYAATDLNALRDIITRKYQTISYFGEIKDKIAEFILSNGLSGVDRIVPIGKTADFTLVWDGYDLISQMSRIIDF